MPLTNTRRGKATESARASDEEHVGELLFGWSRTVAFREWIVLSGLLVVAIAMRFAWSNSMAIDHFDEGVYASNIWVSDQDSFAYPNRHFYAPPLLPLLTELCIICGGSGGMAPLMVNLVVGSLTVGLVWIASRSWFGPRAAIMAMTLAAMSDIHLLYCRTALTDILLSGLVLLAVWIASIGLSRQRIELAVLSGLVTGLAWWTKYNGWLPLAIVIAGTGGWSLWDPAARLAWKRNVLFVGILVATAIACWLPLWWSIQSEPGGYAAVASNHAKYVVGFGGWGQSLARQIAISSRLDSWIGIAAIAIGLALSCSIGNVRFDWRLSLAGAVLMIVGLLVGTSLLFAVCGFVGLALICLVAPERLACWDRSDGANLLTTPAAWLLLAWFTGLLVATPFYTPYPRLTLPWQLAAWLGCGATAELWFRWQPVSSTKMTQNLLPTGLITFVIIGSLLLLNLRTDRPNVAPVAWQDRGGLRKIAHKIAHRMLDTVETHGRSAVVFYVYAEPALYFYLNHEISARRAEAICRPIADLSFAGEPTAKEFASYLIAGPHAQQTPEFVNALAANTSSLPLKLQYEYQPSFLVQSNQLGSALSSMQEANFVKVYQHQNPAFPSE